MASSTAATATLAHPKVEKKIMDEKIAKVREVVKNVSTNDIVLALHNFDLDVGRTIHAFCEGGSETALGDWEKTGGAKKRNKKKKQPTGGASVEGQSTGGLTKGTFGNGSISSSISSFSTANGFSPSSANQNHQNNRPAAPQPMLNGSATPLSATAASLPPNKVQGEMAVLQNGGSGQQPPHVATVQDGNNSNKHGQQPQQPKELFNNDTAAVPNFTQPIGAPYGGGENQNHLDQNKALFQNEIAVAQNNIQRCFKEMRDSIAHREQQLLAALSECQRDGLAYFAARQSALLALNESTGGRQSKAHSAKLEAFNAAKPEELETALTCRFLYEKAELTALVQSIGQFGKVIPVQTTVNKPEQSKSRPSAALTAVHDTGRNTAAAPVVSSSVPAPLRRSNSPNSLVSSMDSGLGGQISPVNQEKPAPAAAGPMAQVEEGGIVLKSQTISADQLAEIQRHMLESLKAKGIDPSVLAEISSSAVNNNTFVTAPRRRQPPPAAHPKANGGGKANSNKQQNGGGQQQQKRGAGKPPHNQQQQQPKAANKAK